MKEALVLNLTTELLVLGEHKQLGAFGDSSLELKKNNKINI